MWRFSKALRLLRGFAFVPSSDAHRNRQSRHSTRVVNLIRPARRRRSLQSIKRTLCNEYAIKSGLQAWQTEFCRSSHIRRTRMTVIWKLHAALVKSLNSNEVNERFQSLGAEARPMSAEEFASFVRSDIQKCGLLIRELGIKLED